MKLSKKELEHIEMHKAIDQKIEYILNHVSANGNPGLENSLRDLYKGQKEIHSKLDEIYTLVKPDLDKAALWKQVKSVYAQSWIAQCFKTKWRATFSLIIILIAIQIITHPFTETSLSLAAIFAWAKKIVSIP